MSATHEDTGSLQPEDDLVAARMERELAEIELRLLGGEMKAFGTDQDGFLKRINSMRQQQSLLALEHMALDTNKHPYADVDDEGFEPSSVHLQHVGDFFRTKEAALTRLATKLHELGGELARVPAVPPDHVASRSGDGTHGDVENEGGAGGGGAGPGDGGAMKGGGRKEGARRG